MGCSALFLYERGHYQADEQQLLADLGQDYIIAAKARIGPVNVLVVSSKERTLNDLENKLLLFAGHEDQLSRAWYAGRQSFNDENAASRVVENVLGKLLVEEISQRWKK